MSKRKSTEETTERRESFVFYRSFYESIKGLPIEAQILMFRAVTEYGLNQVVPDFKGVPYQRFVEAIFTGMRPQIDANYKRYLNGKNGGAPLGNQNARKQPKNNQKQPNVNVNDNVNVNEDKKDPDRSRGLNLPFTDREFLDTWNDLISQPKWKNKSTGALNMALKRLSEYDVRFAILLMQNAIVGNYQGIVFSDTPTKYQQWLRDNPPAIQDTAVITDLNNLYSH